MGSNQPFQGGEVRQTLTLALQLLQSFEVSLRSCSRIYLTPAFPVGAGPDYLNAVLEVSTSLSSQGLMDRLHKVEESLGRTRCKRWESRIIDLDLLAYGAAVIPSTTEFLYWKDLPFEDQKVTVPDQLIVPHPRLHERAFVLVPLLDIAADWRHPVLGETVQELVANLPQEEVSAIVPFADFPTT